MSRIRAFYFFILALFILILAACATAPVTGRQQLILIDPRTELRLGLEASREILRKEKICRDPRLNRIVRIVGERIARATEKDLPWEFFVIDKPKVVNAFCLPGGKVFVYTGIIPVAQNEAGLAAVMGHEIAHAIARHGAERVSLGIIATLGEVALSELLDLKDPQTRKIFLAAYGIGATVGLILPYSRKQELEADHIGLYLMAKAGYDPREAVFFWKRMREAARGKPRPPAFLSTHPADEERIAQIKRLLPRVIPLYEASPQKFGKGEKLPSPRCP